MAHGRAKKQKTFSTCHGARTPGPARDRPVLLDAMACVRCMATASMAKVMRVVFFSPAMAEMHAGVPWEPARRHSFSPIRATSFGVGGSSLKSAPSQLADTSSDDGERAVRPLAVLLALFAFALVLLLLQGCQAQPVSTAPGVDRAAGTGLQINDHADAVLRDLRRMP